MRPKRYLPVHQTEEEREASRANLEQLVARLSQRDEKTDPDND
jgi:hypothetical protein